MKKSALYVQNEASIKFNPYTLKNFLIRAEDGTVIVDRTKALQNKDTERLFLVVLNRDYLWGYRDFEHVTIYFEVDGEKVIGGVYNTRTNERETHRIIATRYQGGLCDHYSYTPNILNAIIDAIHRTTEYPVEGKITTLPSI